MREEKQQYANWEGGQRYVKELRNTKEDVLTIMLKLPVSFKHEKWKKENVTDFINKKTDLVLVFLLLTLNVFSTFF